MSTLMTTLKKMIHPVALMVGLFGFMPVAFAGQTSDQLSDCLVKNVTAQDKTTVLQWTYAALSAHPDLKAFSTITPEQKDQLDQKMAQALQRVIVDQCAEQTKAVIQTEGVQGVTQSFQQLGRGAGEEIVKDPSVNKELKSTLRYIDLNKVMFKFFTPDLLSKLGT
jgi:hypothetical protein